MAEGTVTLRHQGRLHRKLTLDPAKDYQPLS
jgi:hypothetical protein